MTAPAPGAAAELPLHVTVRGEGPPVVFLHGYGASSFTWRHQAGDLAADHTVVTVDLKGFGAAPKPHDDAYGPADQARLVTRLMVERDFREVTLVGHSLGGGLALLTALMLEDLGEGGRLVRLASVAGAAYPQPLPFYIDVARRRLLARALLGVVPTSWLVRKILQSIVHDPEAVTDLQVTAYSEPLRDPACRRAVVESARRIVPPDAHRWTARYPEIELPTLLLWGRGDPVVPLWVGQRLAAEMPRSRLVVLDRCGHVPPEELPAETTRELRTFLASTPPPPPRCRRST